MTSTLQTRAQRDLNNMASFLRRKHLTGWVKDRNASGQYRVALQSVLAIEDAEGIEAAARFSDRLTALRQEAQARHLLSVEDICAVERRVIA